MMQTRTIGILASVALFLAAPLYGQVQNVVRAGKIVASDAEAGDAFGNVVAIDADLIVVNVPGDSGLGQQSGAVKVYRLAAGGAGSEVTLQPPEVEMGDLFGIKLDVNGDVIVVAAPGDDAAASDAGAAYVFRWDGSSWIKEQKLFSPEAMINNGFGESVAVKGDVIVVGQENASAGAITNTGAAYVYRFDGTVWNYEQKLTASNAASNDSFSESISFDGSRIVIGAGNHATAGAAYVYAYDGTVWNETHELAGSGAGAGDRFGHSVDIEGDLIIVGAPGHDVVGAFSGAAYVYRFDGTDWIEDAKLIASDPMPNHFFGISVALNQAEQAVAGAHGDNNFGGAAYTFGFDGVGWVEEQKVSELDYGGDPDDYFGYSVAYTDEVLVAGAWGDDEVGLVGGAVYILTVSERLSGRPLADYPFFEFVRAVNEGDTVHFALDPTLHTQAVGMTGDIYVVNAKTLGEWLADRTLSDVVGGPLTVMIVGSDIQSNTFQIDSGTLAGPTGDEIGVGYDVIFDLNQDGLLDVDDLIDGLSDEAGFYVVRNVEQPGPHAVSSFLYSSRLGPFLQQNTFYPSDIATLGVVPLVVISHGNGHDYKWYDHLGTHLASYGYIVMSHANDTMPGIEEASTTTLTNTDHLLGHQSTIAGGVLDGHIDSSRIVWIGHSRGAEGIVRAYDRLVDGTFTPMHFTADDIRLLSSIAPTAFLNPVDSDPHDIDYHLWVGSADSDVTGGADEPIVQSYRLLERATGWRSCITLQGASHSVFHNGPASASDPGSAGPTGPCPITKSDAHKVMRGYILPLIRRALTEESPSGEAEPVAKDFLWRQWEGYRPIGGPAGLCNIVNMELKERPRFVIDDYETQPLVINSSSGGIVTATVSNISEGLLDDADLQFAWTPIDPMNGMTRAWGPAGESTNGVVFDWDTPSVYEFEVIGDQKNFGDDSYLSFRACQGTRHPNTEADSGDLTFAVVLRDTAGTESSISVGVGGGGVEVPYQRGGLGTGFGWGNEFETIRLAIGDFLANGSGLDLTSIVSVKFDFGGPGHSSKGRLGVDDVMLVDK